MRLTLALVFVFAAPPALAQSDGFCTRASPANSDPARDIYCVDLIPRPDLQGAAGVVELARVPSPFDVTVSPDGHLRSRLIAQFSGLPDPRSLGPYRSLVAWIAPPVLAPLKKLGEVRNGRVDLGITELDKFVILVSAESSAAVSDRRGRLVLRGNSPSVRLARHDLLMLPPAGEHTMDHRWPMPPMDTTIPMLMPGIDGLVPPETPFLPGAGMDPAVLPLARLREIVDLKDGDTLRLEAGLVRRTINGHAMVMYAFNGQHPGPLIRVRQGSAIVVEFVNSIDQPSAVHWHGIRLDNASDGAVGVTQQAVPPGGRFIYRIKFPDAGTYWYHSHVREDVQQDLGLFGNLVVQPRQPGYLAPVSGEEFLILDDLLLGEGGLVPYGTEHPIHALMGRFGNVLLVNGEPGYQRDVGLGEVVRYHLTNVSNTRTFNLSFAGARMKLVAGDVSRFEREEWVESIAIAPAQRYVVDVYFGAAGRTAILNRVQALNHSYGYYFPQVDTLGVITVRPRAANTPGTRNYESLRANNDVTAEIRRYQSAIAGPPDRELLLTLRTQGLPLAVEQILQLETAYFSPVEWSGTMPMMDWLATGQQAHWILRDMATGNENEAIDWKFRRGDVAKVRLVSDRGTMHAMQHPIHLHGQRFLVLSQNGVKNENLVWKDTVLLPAGATADILVEMSNPGRWMMHCHIAEHLQAGMMAVFEVN